MGIKTKHQLFWTPLYILVLLRCLYEFFTNPLNGDSIMLFVAIVHISVIFAFLSFEFLMYIIWVYSSDEVKRDKVLARFYYIIVSFGSSAGITSYLYDLSRNL